MIFGQLTNISYLSKSDNRIRKSDDLKKKKKKKKRLIGLFIIKYGVVF